MASHAGLVLVLETKDGYIDDMGNITQNIEKALKVSYGSALTKTAYQIFQEQGFYLEGLAENDIRLSTFTSSYEYRIDELAEIYQAFGYDRITSYKIAEANFRNSSLSDYQRFQIFKKALEEALLEFRKEESIQVKIEDNNLYLYSDKNSSKVGEMGRRDYFSSTEKIYSYHIELKNPHIEKYFACSKEEQDYYNNWQVEGLEEYLKENIVSNRFSCHLSRSFKIHSIKIENGKLFIYMNDTSIELETLLMNLIRDYYTKREMHITRMFGSYILLQRKENGLEAVKATPIPIQYCPLMVKLLKEVGGDYAETLLATLKTEDKELQVRMICNLINEVVIKGGYFDTSRPLNSCEANVLFGASEIMSSAFKSNLIDAAVIVSNNLGTIITTNDSNTQGAVKRMTGLFYTSPSEELIKIALDSSIIPVFPMSAEIDQLEGVKKAIELGYKRIAVSVAASDNILHKELKKLEGNGIQIYKFGLCSTGISEEVALAMQNDADVIWSCASKYVKELIEPRAIAQVGLKIPVHIMTPQGWSLVRNHLLLNGTTSLEEDLVSGDEKPIYLNDKGKLKVLKKKEIGKCTDCPHPCI